MLKASRSRPIYLRQWRQHRQLSQDQLAERLECDRSLISKIETGKIEWTQGFLEAAADALMCDPVDLLIRDPTDPDGIWSIWERAGTGDKARIVRLAKAILEDKTGT